MNIFSPKVTAAQPGMVHFSEIFPNPFGDEVVGEWIEIFNPRSDVVDLSGWVLRDTAGAITSFGLDGISIHPSSYLLLSRGQTGITLNNDVDGIELLNNEGLVVSSVSYVSTTEDKSFCLIDDVWALCDPSPGKVNLIPSPSPSPSPSPTPSQNPSPSPSSSPSPSPSPIIQNIGLPAISISEVSSCGPEKEWVELQVSYLDQTQSSIEEMYFVDFQGNIRTIPPIHQTGYVVVEFQSAMLNNDGDNLSLFSANGVKLDQLSISKCESGASWSKNSQGIWGVSQPPSKGSENTGVATTANNNASSGASPSGEYQTTDAALVDQNTSVLEEELETTLIYPEFFSLKNELSQFRQKSNEVSDGQFPVVNLKDSELMKQYLQFRFWVKTLMYSSTTLLGGAIYPVGRWIISLAG